LKSKTLTYETPPSKTPEGIADFLPGIYISPYSWYHICCCLQRKSDVKVLNFLYICRYAEAAKLETGWPMKNLQTLQRRS
jgi:hypothetical protein